VARILPVLVLLSLFYRSCPADEHSRSEPNGTLVELVNVQAHWRLISGHCRLTAEYRLDGGEWRYAECELSLDPILRIRGTSAGVCLKNGFFDDFHDVDVREVRWLP
jgi:hypothetical protein